MRTLVADDHAGYRLLVRTALHAAGGFEVVGEVADVQSLAPAATTTEPDVAIIDLLLPGGGGFAAAQVVRERRPGCAVVLTSAHALEDLGVDDRVGDIAFLSKRTRPAHLSARVREIVAVIQRDEVPLAEDALALPPERTSAASARHFAQETLERWGCGDLVETVKLLVSELVTNAIIHARTHLEVRLILLGDRLRVEVCDRSATQVHRREAHEDDTSGRGAELIDLLARAWGLVGRDGGKCLWFELDLPDRMQAPA